MSPKKKNVEMQKANQPGQPMPVADCVSANDQSSGRRPRLMRCGRKFYWSNTATEDSASETP